VTGGLATHPPTPPSAQPPPVGGKGEEAKSLAESSPLKRVLLKPEDWEMWRGLRSFELQYKLLCEWFSMVPKGLFADKLAADPDWEDLTAAEKARKMVELLFRENVVRTYRVGNDYYIGFPYGLEVRSLDDYAREILTAFYADLLSVPTYTLALWNLKARAKPLEDGRLNPQDALLLDRGIYSLKELKLTSFDDVIDPLEFEKNAPVFTWKSELRLDGFSVESYSVEENAVYRAWRSHFDDRNWEYFTDAVGTWLAPFPFKLIVFLVGPSDCGKTTLLHVLTKPIKRYVASVSISELLGYVFGLEPLLGKWVNVRSEKGATVLKNLDKINTVFGGSEEIDVPRKHKSAARLKALKCGIFAMNELPVISESEGETLTAFFNRLSIIEMRKPEGFEPIPNFEEKVSVEEAFKFLVWCRWQLEKHNWVVRKPDPEEMLDKLCNPFRRLEDWWNSRVVEDPDARVKGSEAYDDYRTYCLERGLAPLDRGAFYALVSTKAVRYERDKVTWFRGFRLLKSEETQRKRERELLREAEARWT